MEYFIQELSDALIPLGIIVVLPIMIVWLIMRGKINSDNKNAEVLIKAVENNCVQDVDKILEGIRKPSKSDREILMQRLLRGCIFSFVGLPLTIIGCVLESLGSNDTLFYWLIGGVCLAIGVAYLVVYFVSLKMMRDDKN